LQFGQDYYWRIDEVGGLGTITGPVWTFRTIGYCLMHYRFDGIEDADLPDPIIDYTGSVAFEHWKGPGSGGSSTYGPTNPLVNTDGTSAHFRPEYEVSAGLCREVLGSEPLDLDGPAYTVEMWVRQDSRGSEQAEEEDFEATLFRRYDRSYVIAIGDDGAVRFVHAGYGDSGRTLESPADRIGLGQWHHIAAVFDSTDPARAEKLYVDGLLADDSNSSTLNPSDDDDPVTIGLTVNPLRAGPKHASNPFNGLIDELRIVDIALGPAQFLVRGDPALAWLPIPYDQAKEVPPAVQLIWEPGAYADSHDVYLGTDYASVDDANQTIHPDVHYSNIDVNSYDIPFVLELGQLYYWRIDEVNTPHPNSPWKGDIWRFTVAEYATLDDMEDYTPDYGSDYPISDFSEPYGWDCGFTNATGSMLSLQTGSPVRGEQSMVYTYDNTVYGYYYSEISNHFVLDPCDWTALNLASLTLWFHGDPNNDADYTEQMYVGVEDTAHNYAEVRYPLEDMDNIRVGEWQQWNIDLHRFAGVNLSTVQKLYIGFGDRNNTSEFGGVGAVCVDDVRLYIPRCMSEYGPVNDLNEDCIINYADIRILADDWLYEGGSVADLHEDGKVNSKDFATLANSWLQQQLWP
ncbi:MAG: LamG-like jellyroll fold domain-containing protein, partial [Planctomycetota bacterium]